VSFTHLFSSHLQRAAKTAGKLREAQLAPDGEDNAASVVPNVVQLPLLVEKNFGSMEGKKSYGHLPGSKLTRKDHNCLESKGTAGFVDVESKDSMAQRADTFLDKHLLPLMGDTSGASETCIALVSHGIFLSTLWKRFLLRLPPKSVALSPELQATGCPSIEHLGGWSNTGYLELHMIQSVAPDSSSAEAVSKAAPVPCASPAETPVVDDGLGEVDVSPVCNDPEDTSAEPPHSTNASSPRVPTSLVAHRWKTTILAINSKDHLNGLKRTGGGVGSSRHDTSQKSIESFFKRRKLE
jgi:broad specificity phosphatase PhoE